MRFFIGLHQPSDAKHFGMAFISVNRIKNRKSPFEVGDWIMDSGAFSTILAHGLRAPRDLDTITDVVLRYRPPEKAKATKRREKRRAKRVAKKG